MKKKIILSVILIALLIIGSVLIYEKNNRVSIIENIKNRISKQEENTKQITTVDITGIKCGKETLHEHIYKTMYDENKHWEECISCNEKINEQTHTFTTIWANGSESCHKTNYYSNICDCGYKENRHKPCVWDGKTYLKAGSENGHQKMCTICSDVISYCYYLNSYGNGLIYEMDNYYEQCYSKEGKALSCKNFGTCSKCGYVYSENKKVHKIKKNYIDAVNSEICCQECNENFGKVYMEGTKDNNVPATYTATITVNLNDNNTIDANGINFGGFIRNMEKSNIEILDRNATNSYIKYKITATFKNNITIGNAIYTNNSIYINGVYQMWSVGFENSYPDSIKPVIENISIGDNDTWEKIRTITITGTENWTNIVRLKIIDDKEEIIYECEGKVINGKYSISCTPELEAGIKGRIFKAVITDTCENEVEQTFEISKIDSIPPVPISEANITGNWVKEREFTFEAQDQGIGNVQIAFNDVIDYQSAIKEEEKYTRTYKFIGDAYEPTKAKIFYKDQLGNVTSQEIVLDKIDNTAPTITNARIHNNNLLITANDIKEGLGEGSGVSKYRYITSTEKLTNPEITETAVEVNSNENIIIENISQVKYIYVVAEDLVGNISEIYEVEVPQLVLTSKVNLSVANGKGGIELDWSSYDLADKYFVIYRKEENASEWEKIVSLEDKLTGGKYTDVLANDKTNPSVPTINIEGKQENNNIEITQSSIDTGTKYTYYIEAYDLNTNILLSKSNS